MNLIQDSTLFDGNIPRITIGIFVLDLSFVDTGYNIVSI